MLSVRLLVVAAMTLAAACGGGTEIGGACENAGSADECVSDAVCTNDSSGNTCRKVCEDHVECAANERCNGVTGSSIKSCQPDR